MYKPGLRKHCDRRSDNRPVTGKQQHIRRQCAHKRIDIRLRKRMLDVLYSINVTVSNISHFQCSLKLLLLTRGDALSACPWLSYSAPLALALRACPWLSYSAPLPLALRACPWLSYSAPLALALRACPWLSYSAPLALTIRLTPQRKSAAAPTNTPTSIIDNGAFRSA